MTAKSGNAARDVLLVDIGNTNVSLATWSGGKRGEVDRHATDPLDHAEEAMAKRWLSLPASAARAMVISSVCPAALARLRASCRERGIGPLLVLGQEVDLPMGVDMPAPEKVGTDRICAAVAAYYLARGACVVAGFGTALTIDLVADDGVFLGGTILPGLALSARALHEHTALLPLVKVGPPEDTLGKDTESAIRNGIFAMMVGALREISERYATQIGKWPPLILTGGDAELIASGCDFIDRVVPDLCLDGLLLAYKLHLGWDDDD